jgi:hypothetical protein
MLAACALVVELIDARGWAVADVAEKAQIPPVFARNLERVGRKHLMPELVWGETPGRRRLARMPLAEQARLMGEPLPVATVKGDVLQVGLDSLTPELCRQVFDGPRVRSLGEQRAWLEVESRKVKPVGVADYEVVGRQLVVHSPCKMTRAQIARALAEMES